MTLFKRIFPSPLEPILALTLPFAWFGGLGSTPWWVILLWIAALVLRRADTAHRFVGIPLLVLIAFGLSLAFYPDPWGMVTEFFKLCMVGIGLYLAYGSLLEGSAFGLVPLGIMLIFHPHPLGLGALLIGLIALGETSMRGQGKIRSGRALPLLLGGVVSLVLLSALLPRAGLTLQAPPRGESAQRETETRPTEPTELSTPPRDGPARGPVVYNLPTTEDPVPAWVKEVIKATLSLIMVACIVLFCIILWKPIKLAAGPRVKLWHFIFLGSVFAFSAMLLLYLGLSTGNTLGGSGGSGGSSLPNTGPSSIVNLSSDSPEVQVYTIISYILLFALPLLLAFLVYGAWTLWQIRPQQLTAATLSAPTEIVLEPGVIPPLNPDTVRALYARFLEHMRERGLLRLESETPWEFWRTVSRTHPELEDDAHALTWAYMPVRYGDLPDREGFEAAFRALEHLESVPLAERENTLE